MTKLSLCMIIFLSFALSQTDTIKPLITLGSSVKNVTEPITLSLSANVLDSGGVDHVEFYQNSVKIREEFEAPYNLSLPLTAGNNGTLEFYAIAFDKAGNSNSSQIVAITVNIAAPAIKAGNDTFSTFVNTPLSVGDTSIMTALHVQGNILQNDGIAAARVSGTSNVVGGSLELSPTGGFVFIPDTGFIGLAGFDYTLESSAGQAAASVTIRVQEANAETAGDQMLWYVRAGSASGEGSGGDGSAVNPFATLAEAEIASQPGDVIFVSAGTYTCRDTCFTLKPYQKIIGEASGLSLDEAATTQGEAPILKAISTGFALANQTTIKGFNVVFDAQEGSAGLRGNDLLAGNILIEDMSIDNPGGFGVLINESDAADAKTGAKHSLVLRNVTVNRPGQIGIVSNDALAVRIENCIINGVSRNPNNGFSGRGILVESEFNTHVTISDTTVSSISTDEVFGVYLLKNNAFGNAVNATTMSISLNNNTVTLGETGLAYRLEVFAGATDFPADKGTLTLSGLNNTTNATQAVNFASGSATVRGNVEINGTVYPQ
jgi:Bacterial Ig domain